MGLCPLLPIFLALYGSRRPKLRIGFNQLTQYLLHHSVRAEGLTLDNF